MREFDPQRQPTFAPTQPAPAATAAPMAAPAAGTLRLDARLVIALEHASDAMAPLDEDLMGRVTARLAALIATVPAQGEASAEPVVQPAPAPRQPEENIARDATLAPAQAAKLTPKSSSVRAPGTGLGARAGAALAHALAKLSHGRRAMRSKPPGARGRTTAARRQAMSHPLVQFGAAAGFTTLVVCTGYAVVNPSGADLQRWGVQLSAVAHAARAFVELGAPAMARSSMTASGRSEIDAALAVAPGAGASQAPSATTGATVAVADVPLEAPSDAPPGAACEFRQMDLREISRDGATQILSGGAQGLGLLAARRAPTNAAKPGRVAVLELRPASAMSCRVTIDGWTAPRVLLAESAGGHGVLVVAQATAAGDETLRFFDARTCAPFDQVGVGRAGWRISEGKVLAVPGDGLEAARVRELGGDCRPLKSDVAAVADTVVLPTGPTGPASSVLPLGSAASAAASAPLGALPNPKFTSSKLSPVKVSEAASAAAALAALPVADFPAIAASAPGLLPVNWSSSLELPGPADLTWRMALPFVTPISMENEDLKGRATNCNSLLALRSKGYVGVNDEALGAASREGARCMALSLLAKVRPAARSMLADFKLDVSSPKLLPASLMAEVDEATEDIVAEAERLGRSLQTAHTPMFPKIEGRQLVLVGKTWESRLEVLARGDFNGDGFEDLLVLSEGHPVDGTLTTAKLVLVSKTLPDGPIKTVKRII